MRFGHIELFVRDPVRARDFYVEVLGFSVTDEQGPEDGPPRFIWLELDGSEILLRPGAPNESPTFGNATSNIVFYTRHLEASARALRQRGLVFQGEDGPGCLTFTDLDGHWFQLVQPEE
jgi:catechol 2,3-dioxygenase-like lactoylglutathione lyase family enzyme